MDKNFNHLELEDKIYRMWEKSGYFAPDKLPGERKETFSIALPPPNVTGTLHIGQAYETTLQDILVRFERMRGKKTLWVPGTDHAAIATQAKVEKKIYEEEGKSRHDLGREELLRRVMEFALESQNMILTQLRKMGVSLDWSRLAFTLDEKRAKAVYAAFKKMYDAGLIYRGHRIVNWDPKGQTTVSDDEIEWVEEQTAFYYLKYGPFEIGTARPETKFGDKYVVMHPKDKRYEKYEHGQKIELEWINGPITATIIKDEVIDMEFGTGVMTITPWHDNTDFEIAERHNLEKEQIIDLEGKLLPIAEEFKGLSITEARSRIVAKLKQKSLLVRTEENYTHRIATNSRGNGVIEPQIMKQWFVNVNKKFKLKNSKLKGIRAENETTLKEIMRKTISSGQIKITPEQFEKRYFHWIDNLRDWCISRQIWFGHRIPVWYCGKKAQTMKRMGFAGDVVPQVFNEKTLTYRLRDYGLAVGDKVAFEDSAKRTVFGYGTITEVLKMTVGEIDLKDKRHWKTYENRGELIVAFKRHYPEKEITENTPAWLYTYTFDSTMPKNGCGNLVVSKDKPTACLSCGRNENLTQDPDTLDTWFSSGLWTFSTLGWPEETDDLKTYHPTNLMSPGYEILYLWISRMIFLSGFLLGEIPFKTALMHGIVRDEKGRKFSKSSGIGGDPREVIELYGADALRMALVSGVAIGNDPVFQIERVKAYKHFANKVWNVGRFLLMNKPNDYKQGDGEKFLKPDDKKRLKELEKIKKEITKHYENFELHLACEKIYHFLWNTFANNILEERKERLKNGGEEDKLGAYCLLETIYKESLKMLHPFMPFVTEQIYQEVFAQNSKLLLVEEW